MLRVYINLEEHIEFLKRVKENFKEYIKHPENKKITLFKVKTFEQLWGNTSGGFQGIGGSAMTTQLTIVLIPVFEEMNEPYQVWFDGKYAYSSEPTKEFLEKIKNEKVEGLIDFLKEG